jgi:hypothetical protein
MGEAKRRRKAIWPTSDEFVAGLETYIGEGFHLFDLWVVYGPELPGLWHAGRRGDRKAACRHDLACEMIVRAGRASTTDQPALCLLCDHLFTDLAALACIVIVNRYEQPTGAICNAVCEVCERQQELLPRIVARYREFGVISDARVVSHPSPPGHA